MTNIAGIARVKFEIKISSKRQMLSIQCPRPASLQHMLGSMLLHAAHALRVAIRHRGQVCPWNGDLGGAGPGQKA